MSIPLFKEMQTRTLRAGLAKREITTELPGKTVRDWLFAKVLVLDDHTNRLVLLTLDAVAIGDGMKSCSNRCWASRND